MTFYQNDQAETTDIKPARLGSNKSADGYIISEKVGEAVEFGNFLYLGADNKYYKAKADSINTLPVVTVALQAIAANKHCPMLLNGIIRDDGLNLSPRSLMYCSDVVAGGISISPPNSTSSSPLNPSVGYAMRSNQYYFAPHYSDAGELSELTRKLNTIQNYQTHLISFPVWSEGEHTILQPREHQRIKIIEAWATLGDNTNRSQTLELMGVSQPLHFSNSYTSGSIKPFEVMKMHGKIPYFRSLKVKASTARRTTINLLVTSYEGEI